MHILIRRSLIITFGLTYLLGMTLLLAVARTWTPVLSLGFLWPATIIPAMRGLAPTLAIIAALIAVIWYGYRKSLRAFPWNRNTLDYLALTRATGSLGEIEIRIPGLNNTVSARNLENGWPFLQLSSKVEEGYLFISKLKALALSALAGWWSYCVIVGVGTEPSPAFIATVAFVAALLRLGIYCSGLMPSFNLWGRLSSGRIIVPGFDQVLLTPMLVIGLATVGGMVIRHSGPWYPVTTACVVSAVCFALFGGGPTIRNWILTGEHRYRAPNRLNTNQRQLRPI
jgi:hypothetical protein